jgi:hypothetical protein
LSKTLFPFYVLDITRPSLALLYKAESATKKGEGAAAI